MIDREVRAISYDLDDVVIDRGIPSRVAGLVVWKVKPHQIIVPRPQGIPVITRGVVDSPIKDVREMLSFAFHARRRVVPGVKAVLEANVALGIDVYGNTGRSNKRAWVEMTRRTLESGGVAGYFRDIFYTPDGIKNFLSKAAAIRDLRGKYGEGMVEHYEDDPRTAYRLAMLFPDVSIYLVHYGTTGLSFSRRELDALPNLHRVAVFGNSRNG